MAAATLSAPWQQPTITLEQGDAQTAGAEEALAPLAELLETRGYNQNEIDVAIGMVHVVGLERSAVSLVYVPPDGLIDQHIWLRFRPEPTEVIRTAIVVVTNIDPNLSDQIELLVAELGHDDWATRERAQRELLNLGEAAIETVERMRNSDDAEIAFRAQQIIDTHNAREAGLC